MIHACGSKRIQGFSGIDTYQCTLGQSNTKPSCYNNASEKADKNVCIISKSNGCSYSFVDILVHLLCALRNTLQVRVVIMPNCILLSSSLTLIGLSKI